MPGDAPRKIILDCGPGHDDAIAMLVIVNLSPFGEVPAELPAGTDLSLVNEHELARGLSLTGAAELAWGS